MAPAPKLEAKTLSPEILAALQHVKQEASEIDRGHARDAIEKFLKTKMKATGQQTDFILQKEFDRKPQRQPRPTDKGDIIRTNKKGEMIEVLTPEYFLERYQDILPTQKVAEGETDLALAAQATANLTMQSLLVKKYGVDGATRLMALAGGELGKATAGAVPSVTGKNVDPANPWRSGNAPGAAEARAEIVKSRGTKVAQALAQQAGTDIAGRPLKVA